MTGGSLTKQEMAARISEELGFPVRSSKRLVDGIFSIMKEALNSGEPVKIVRFGTFHPVFRDGRKGMNPSTGEAVLIPARRTVLFRPSRLLKKLVNAEKRSQILPNRGSQQDSRG